jgi:hypothetical protein
MVVVEITVDEMTVDEMSLDEMSYCLICSYFGVFNERIKIFFHFVKT